MPLEIGELRYHDRGPIDLVIEAGECVSLVGASGAGKTLLLRALADLDPHAGRVALDGVSSAHMPAPQWRRRVGMLPSESAWWSDVVSDHFPDNVSVGELTPFGFEAETLSWRYLVFDCGRDGFRGVVLRMVDGAAPLRRAPSTALGPAALVVGCFREA